MIELGRQVGRSRSGEFGAQLVGVDEGLLRVVGLDDDLVEALGRIAPEHAEPSRPRKAHN